LRKDIATAQGLLAAAGFAAVVLCLFLPLVNPDIFWHLSAGRFIFSTGALPRADFLSWSMAGRPWTDFEWLPQLLYFSAWKAAGYHGLLACKLGLLSALLAVMCRIFLLHAGRLETLLWLPVLCAVLLPNLDLRPENFSLLFFSIVLLRLEKVRLLGAPARFLAPAAATGLLFALWANCHAGFMYGLLLLGFYAAGELLRVRLPAIYGKRAAEDYSAFRFYVLLFACAAAGTLLNANGTDTYAVVLSHVRDVSVIGEHLQEWQPAELAKLSQAPFWALLLLSSAALLHRALRHADLHFGPLAAWLCFAYSAAEHSRMTAFFGLLAAPYLAAVCADTLKDARRAGALVLSALALAATLFLGVIEWRHLKDKPWKHSSGAAGAARFLAAERKELSGLRLYNPWGWGGYLGFELPPEYKIFQDGRYIFHGLLTEVQAARADNASWARFLKKYDFQLVLLERSAASYPSKVSLGKLGDRVIYFPFYSYFMPSSEWALVFWDNSSLLFVRRSQTSQAWLEQNEFRQFKPDNFEGLRAKLEAGLTGKTVIEAESERQEKLLRGLGLEADALRARVYASALLSK